MSEEAWRRFTPAQINAELCLARTWNNCAGGQCSKRPIEGQDFCKTHEEKWKVHGRVDGPIPEKKLKEFERHSNQPGSSGVAASPAPKKRASQALPTSPVPEKRQRKTQASSAKADEKPSSKASATKADEKPSAKASATKAKAGEKPSSKASAAKADEKPSAKAPATKAKADEKPSSKASATKAGSAKSAQKVIKQPKCTCGKLIHSEKCMLFRLMHRPQTVSRPTIQERPSTQVPPERRPPKQRHVPTAGLSSAVEQEVSKIHAEIASLPRDQRKAAWKNQMRQFHPDKSLSDTSSSLTPEQRNEAFIEIKRRYDAAAKQEQPSTTRWSWRHPWQSRK